MKNIKGFKRVLLIVMAFIIFTTNGAFMKPAKISAASKYITVEAFLKYIITGTTMKNVIPVDKYSNQPYIDAAINYGIIKKGEFKNYKANLTRTDCAVIANRLDEKLNFKYNYPQEVYDILSGCKYHDGKLYYNTKGKLYPKGATKDTLPALEFLEDVLKPVLTKNFKFEKWATEGLNAQYEYLRDSEGNISGQYIVFGLISKDENNLKVIPFGDSSYITMVWKKINIGEGKISAVLNRRISDIKKISKNKRYSVASIIAKGIMNGYSNGMYIQNRSFKGSNKITANEAKGVIAKVMFSEKRSQVSPDGQLIRTTNLPKNAKYYDYILECYPNEFYDKKFEVQLIDNWKKEVRPEDYAFPIEMKNETFRNWNDQWPLSEEMDKYLYDWADLAEKYLKYIFNVNYKTVNNKWIEGLGSLYQKSNIDHAESIRNYYLKHIKANHVIIESSIIAVEPSTFYDFNDCYFMRAYVKYRITADDITVKQNRLLHSQYPALDNLESGKWRTGIFDIRFGVNDGSNGDGSDFTIDEMTHFIDAFNVPVK